MSMMSNINDIMKTPLFVLDEKNNTYEIIFINMDDISNIFRFNIIKLSSGIDLLLTFPDITSLGYMVFHTKWFVHQVIGLPYNDVQELKSLFLTKSIINKKLNKKQNHKNPITIPKTIKVSRFSLESVSQQLSENHS